jgi:CDP-diacylglycerol--serine O-phosphatidyltransferase
MVLPVVVVVVLFFALLIAYPWQVLTVGTLCYLASLPFGWLSYRNHERKAAAADATAATEPAVVATAPAATPPMQRPPDSSDEDRPARLN